jgi:hypothetical protein
MAVDTFLFALPERHESNLLELLTYMPAQPIIIIFSIYKLALIAVDMYIQDLFI